jgi:lipopolysaccharide biosynthesis regulator YciM
MRMRAALAYLALLTLIDARVYAAPYVPQDDAYVIERLRDAGAPALRKRVRAYWATARPAAGITLALAEDLLRLARTTGDPRYAGHAEGVLARLAVASPRAHVLRAFILQTRHDFVAARGALAAALSADPRDARAWLLRATIERVQADYGAAARSCARLANLADKLIATTCAASVAAVTGHADIAYAALSGALAESADAEPDVRAWAYSVLADCARARGELSLAETAYRSALAASADNVAIRLAFADLLLDLARAHEVSALLADFVRHDGALLRLALAAHARADETAPQLIAAMGRRVASATARGDRLHLNEAARYAGELAGDAQAALRFARENWSLQREPRDARVLLEAALRARDHTTARAAAGFVTNLASADPFLRALEHRAHNLPR